MNGLEDVIVILGGVRTLSSVSLTVVDIQMLYLVNHCEEFQSPDYHVAIYKPTLIFYQLSRKFLCILEHQLFHILYYQFKSSSQQGSSKLRGFFTGALQRISTCSVENFLWYLVPYRFRRYFVQQACFKTFLILSSKGLRRGCLLTFEFCLDINPAAIFACQRRYLLVGVTSS